MNKSYSKVRLNLNKGFSHKKFSFCVSASTTNFNKKLNQCCKTYSKKVLHSLFPQKQSFDILEAKKRYKNQLSITGKKHNKIRPELIEWGAHIGHKPLRLANTSKRGFYPAVSKYLLGKRQKLNYIDVQHNIKQTLSAIYTIACILNKGGSFLIVNSNQIFDQLMSAQESSVVVNEKVFSDTNFVDLSIIPKSGAVLETAVSKTALSWASPSGNKIKKVKYASTAGVIAFTEYKWIGGALSNWDQIAKTVWRVAKFSEELENFLKSHNINFPRYEELKKSFRGLVEKKDTSIHLCFRKKPDLIFLVNSTENLSILREANSLRIPVMALADSNTNLSGISYPIPVNSESISFFFRFLDIINRIKKC